MDAEEVELQALRERYRQLEANLNKALEALRTISGVMRLDTMEDCFEKTTLASKIVREIENSGSEPTKWT